MNFIRTIIFKSTSTILPNETSSEIEQPNFLNLTIKISKQLLQQ
jgi:hypothetical protein